MSRGLTEMEAKKLIIEAEFAPIIAKIPVAAYQQEISNFLRERLNRFE
jgi:Fe-S cluster assembly scaffold protein SufB